MDTYNDPSDWYEWLVDQSRTDHIYDLIHTYLPHDFYPNDIYDFVLLNVDELPLLLRMIEPAHYKTAYKAGKVIDGVRFAILHNDCLTEFLEVAKQMKVIKDEHDNSYIGLIFTKAAEDEEEEKEEAPTNTARHDDDVLKLCWDLLVAGKDRTLALSYALVGEAFLQSSKQDLEHAGGPASELVRLSTGFNIISAAYCWNDRFTDAARCDSEYLLKPYLWQHMEKVIKPYLEMLLIKKNYDYLGWIFDNQEFREYFRAHYETYMSLKDPHFEWTRQREIVPILNRVNNDKYYR